MMMNQIMLVIWQDQPEQVCIPSQQGEDKISMLEQKKQQSQCAIKWKLFKTNDNPKELPR